jgi:hypothetical protein
VSGEPAALWKFWLLHRFAPKRGSECTSE